jgi:hypothetical protein
LAVEVTDLFIISDIICWLHIASRDKHLFQIGGGVIIKDFIKRFVLVTSTLRGFQDSTSRFKDLSRSKVVVLDLPPDSKIAVNILIQPDISF